MISSSCSGVALNPESQVSVVTPSFFFPSFFLLHVCRGRMGWAFGIMINLQKFQIFAD